jgi:hypothetical protein
MLLKLNLKAKIVRGMSVLRVILTVLSFCCFSQGILSSVAQDQQNLEVSKLKYPRLSKEGFEDLSQLTDSLIQKCKVLSCIPVFMGRSNVLISAQMEAKGIESVQLPLSGLRSIGLQSLPHAKHQFSFKVLRPILLPFIHEHPEAKSLMIVDFVQSGETLVQSSLWIKDFLESSGNTKLKLEVASYGRTLSSSFVNQLESNGIKVNNLILRDATLRAGSYYGLVQQSMVEAYAPYDHWSPLSKSEPFIQPAFRRPYPYLDENVRAFASYKDLVTWFKNSKLLDELPTQTVLECQEWLKHGMRFKF